MSKWSELLAALCCLFAAATARADTTTLDDGEPAITYLGAWSSELDELSRQGGHHSSSAVGAAATLEFEGEFVRVLATTGPDRGRAQVRLCTQDGASCESAELDQRSKIVQHDQVVYARYGLPSARYRIEVLLPAAASGSVTLDGIAFGTALQGAHYIDNRLAVCSNAGPGDSPSAPWCDFSHVNGETFGAGAQLLLARGGVWNQQLGKLYGEGTPERWISIDAYGEGGAPAIRRSGAATDRALWLDNPSYWRVSQLEVAHAGAGIVAYFTTNGHAGLRFDHLFLHDNDSVHVRSAEAWVPAADLPGMYHGAALFITGNVPVTENTAAIRDIEISDVESLHDSDPLDIAGFNPSPGALNFLSTGLGHHAARNVTVHNVFFHDAKGAPNFDNVERLQLFSSLLTRMCTAHQEIGTTALFFWSVADVDITNNVISDVPYTNSPDGTGTDLESVSTGVRFRGNWYMNNVGAGIEVLAARGEGDFQREHELSNNVFYQNGRTGGVFEIDDEDRDVSYVGDWVKRQDTHWHSGSDAAASFTVSFYGAHAALYGTRGPDNGQLAVSLCPEAAPSCEAHTVDAFAATRAPRSLLYQSEGLPSGRYRMTVRVVGARHPESAGSAVELDAVQVWSSDYFLGVPQEASLFFLNQSGKQDAVTGRATSNLYFEPGGFVASEPSGQYQWSFSDNRSVSAQSLFDARVQGLRSERFDGVTYSQTDTLVTPFDLQPPGCDRCAVARAWDAPRAGTIVVRGWALKNTLGGDGVGLRITRNGAQVWPSGSSWQRLGGQDQRGLATQLDDLEVQRGDTLRFEVSAGDGGDDTYDLTSWSPTIAYIRSDEPSLVAVAREALGAGGAGASVRFTGSQVTVHAERGPEHGAMGFALCEDNGPCRPEVLVSLFDAVLQPDSVIWTSPVLPFGSYTLLVRAERTAGGERVVFGDVTVSTDVSFINDDAVEYVGTGWAQTGDIHYHDGATADAYYLVRFFGSQAVITGGKNADRGIAAYSVCDATGQRCGPETQVDTYAPALLIKQALWTSPVLERGEHAIKVRATPQRNPAATGGIIDFDRAIID